MIRVVKSGVIPKSLKSRSKYNKEDVQEQLIIDQHGKCYLCERKCGTDYQVEHLKPHRNNDDNLKYNWDNLFLACSYCNGKKGSNYVDMLNPVLNDIENIIEHDFNYTSETAIFTSKDNDSNNITETIKLLSKLFNGSNGKFRKTKEQEFYYCFMSNLNNFYRLITDYLNDQNKKKQAILDELNIDSEFLGFKYWIIKKNDILYTDFKSYMVWNKDKI